MRIRNYELYLYGVLMIIGAGTADSLLLGGGRRSQSRPGAPIVQQDGGLRSLVGKWTVAVRFEIARGKYADDQAECSAEMILDGRFLRQEYHGKSEEGSPLTVLQLVGYDSATSRYQIVHLNSTAPDVQLNSGKLARDKRSIVLSGRHVSALNGQPEDLRMVLTIQDKEHFLIEWYATQGKSKERLIVRLAHTRRT